MHKTPVSHKIKGKIENSVMKEFREKGSGNLRLLDIGMNKKIGVPLVLTVVSSTYVLNKI